MAKILNLYAGIGGNRRLWSNDHDITAVEHNEEIASLYQKYYPGDTVIVSDANKYLLDHLQDGWDFIWSSPPCPTHSRINTDGRLPPRYPDMSLYQQIIMLGNNWYNGKWVVENVIPYYDPLINPTVKIDRHYYWCNYKVRSIAVKKEKPIGHQTSSSDRYGFNISKEKIKHRKDTILRNLVNPEVGKYLLDRALDIVESENVSQQTLF